jgi:tRNA nucleotidyltransferase (CCA-adding enzyme)
LSFSLFEPVKIYRVGGAVRDRLLGLPVQDHDHVVVGATPEEMLRLGYRPVGKDFPVFLHPQTHEEYALARTERKTAPGYKGFHLHAAPDVTLEQDLARRDLTINAIASDERGEIVDPYGGVADLRAGVLRHVSKAFVEDPVRLLRIARFAARFGFGIADETFALMRRMVEEGEADALVAERVWQEFAKGLCEKDPVRMFTVLRDCGALARVLPQWTALHENRALAALDRAAQAGSDLSVRFATLFVGAPVETAEKAAEHLRAPIDCRDLAVLTAKYGDAIAGAAQLDAEALLDLLLHSDALRRPERFNRLIDVVAFDGKADKGYLLAAAQAMQGVDAGAIAQDRPADIVAALRAARLAALRQYIKEKK